MEKKEITSKTAVRAILTGFVSYGIIILIIFKVFSGFIQKTALNNFSIDKRIVYISLALLYSMVILFTMHMLCRLSTYDVLKKCLIKKEDVDIVSKKLGKIFIVFIIASIILTLVYLYFTLMYEAKIQKQSLLIAEMNYNKTYSEDFVSKLKNEMISDFYTYRANIIAYTFILELGFCISIIAIIPFQKLMIEKYNK
ncbi:MAG: hypothetical protein HFJ46_07555 [Clostridia bacterium]|nr:hypothetical protein [Clostridia bacterium]